MNIKRLQQDMKTAGFYTGGVDGAWGPLSEGAYQKLLASVANVNKPPANRQDPEAMAWGKNVSAIFKQRVRWIAAELEMPVEGVNWLMACMAFESAESFRPDIKNAAGSGACVDTDTEILTKHGWKRYDAVRIGDSIYSMDVGSGKLVDDRVYDLVVKQSENNYRMTSRSFDSLTTHDHRWYLLQRFYSRTDNTPQITERTTEEMVGLKSSHTYSVIHPGPHMVAPDVVLDTEHPLDLYTLVGMIAGDGSINKERLRVELNCHSTCAPKELQAIERCVSAIFPEGVACREMGDMLRWCFSKEQSDKLVGFFDVEYNSGLEQSLFIKKLNPDFAASLNAKSAEALVYGYFVTDGHSCPSNGTESFRSAYREIVDDFMHAAVLAGHNPRSVTDYRGGSEHTFPNGRTYKIKDIHTVWLRKSGHTSVSHAQMKKQRIDEDMTVWCPTTGNRNWIARRSGTVYVTGNCGLIQFMPKTARGLGTSTTALATMTAEDQLNYVFKYFEPYTGRLQNLGDVYMAILWPAGVGKPDDWKLWCKSSREITYMQNAGLDVNKDGCITRGEAVSKVRAKLVRGHQFYYG